MEVMTRDLAVGLTARNHRVGVTCLEEEGPLASSLRQSNVPVSLVPCPGIRSNFRPDARLSAHLRALGCDVVHLHNGVWAKAALASRAARVPGTISTMHGFAYHETWLSEPLRWWGARHSDVVVAVSSSLQRHLVERTLIPARKVTVVGNGIDTERFKPGPRTGVLRSRFGIGADVPVLGCIARLDPVKNHALLLTALKLVLAAMPSARLVLVGDGPLRQQLESEVSQAGLSDGVTFAGAFSDTAPLYRDIDAFVLGSFSEGTSISILEAMASGVPVAATAVGGTPELLAEGECGSLVPSGDPAAMAEAIISILRDESLGARIAANARARAVSKFSLAAMISSYEELYRSIMERTPPMNLNAAS
jgi:glycosyltransferase involved in cell wall biosynthesis